MAMLCNTLLSVTDQRVLGIKDIIKGLFPNATVAVSQEEVEEEKYIVFQIKDNNREEEPEVTAEKITEAYNKAAQHIECLDFKYSIEEV